MKLKDTRFLICDANPQSNKYLLLIITISILVRILKIEFLIRFQKINAADSYFAKYLEPHFACTRSAYFNTCAERNFRIERNEKTSIEIDFIYSCAKRFLEVLYHPNKLCAERKRNHRARIMRASAEHLLNLRRALAWILPLS